LSVRRARFVPFAAPLLLALAPLAPLPSAHPIHSSLAELRWEPASGTVAVSVRVFSDDLCAALATRGLAAGAPPAAVDSAASAYAREAVLVAAPGSPGPLPLHWVGMRRSAEATWLELRAETSAGLAGARVRNAVLFERYGDQINLVRASYAGHTVSLLFTPGDGAKRLP
jgi:hypothetical protein